MNIRKETRKARQLLAVGCINALAMLMQITLYLFADGPIWHAAIAVGHAMIATAFLAAYNDKRKYIAREQRRALRQQDYEWDIIMRAPAEYIDDIDPDEWEEEPIVPDVEYEDEPVPREYVVYQEPAADQENPMKDYEVAILVKVRQRGVDVHDAINRVTMNMQLPQPGRFGSYDETFFQPGPHHDDPETLCSRIRRVEVLFEKEV